ncbi:MAG: prepilin-type N-terminal cleavage/methylation domain-containing protein [Akkermansiaceae bacterium]|jgi:prepilin-type N-terminal cleavage/methylation domain-containing protein|nr:prepilin-type N-terminal cleavage/methylation domain-containing protein [Roseibacillus sp.]
MIGIPTKRRRGFVLMEVVLALTLFGMVGVAYLMSLQDVAELLREMRREAKITRILDSELRKWMSLPQIEEGEPDPSVLDERDQLEVRVVIRPLEDAVEEMRFTTEEGRVLQQMFHIQATASWYEDREWHERTAETWRYARLYQQ